MKVKLKTLSAGANGVIYPGDVVDVRESEAKLLIDGGYAEAVETERDARNEPRAEPNRSAVRAKKKAR